MKKKTLALVLCLALIAVAAIGGTMAYFTDTDTEDNTFAVGGVKIDLVEQQRNAEGTALEPFEDGKTLMPIVGSAQGGNDNFGLPARDKAKNYVDKIIDVKNTGESDCYVRMFLAIPEVLDNVTDAGKNILHFNWNPNSSAEGEWSGEICTAKSVEIDGIKYNVYSRTYNTALAKNATTGTHAYVGFYLDKNVDQGENGYTITRNGVTTPINFDFSNGVTIPVFAQGIQADGFDSAEAAFTASGLPTNPWAN